MLKQRLALWLYLLLSTLATGCMAAPRGTASEPWPPTSVRTTQDTFPLATRGRAQGAIITATITNRSRQPVWVVASGRSALLSLEKWTGREWVPAFSSVWGHSERIIRLWTGESYTDTAAALGWPGATPEFRVPEIPGTYRAVYHIESRDPTNQDPPAHLLPQAALTSNHFVIAPRSAPVTEMEQN